jgi:hypothetical protein
MKLPLAELLMKSAKALPPQRPGRSAYRPLLPLFMAMAENGHTAMSMAEFLVREKEIAPDKRNSAYRSIRNLLARHGS